jgi:cytochrome c-type biogenesis protein CcmH
MRCWLRLIAILLALGPASHALAVQPDEILKDPAQEARARVLSKQLRCMVCQNQSIDDSDAPLARDLRILVRERLQAGDSNSQVLDFMVQRYGEFVLLRPRLHWRTALLWLAPAVLLIGGALILFLLARRRRGTSPADAALPQGGALTPDEERRLAGLIKPEDR